MLRRLGRFVANAYLYYGSIAFRPIWRVLLDRSLRALRKEASTWPYRATKSLDRFAPSALLEAA